MGVIRNLIKKILAVFGYQVARIPDSPENKAASLQGKTQPNRKIVNAYYKGGCLKCYLDDCIGDQILTGKGWDNQLEWIFDQYLAGDTGAILEIGANIGASLIPIAKNYSALHFHCVEPVPAFFELLQTNKRSYGCENVSIYNSAIGSCDGSEIEIYVKGGTAGALAHYDGHLDVETIRVPVVSIDKTFNNLNLKFIKIDVDGFEYQVLLGARHVIEKDMPMIYMEFSTSIMRKVGDPKHVVDILKAAGYRHMTIWDNFGTYIKDTGSYEDLLETADSVPYYVDVLFRF